MATKHVVQADGTTADIPLTPEEEAQAVIDAQRAATDQAARDAEIARMAGYTDDPDRQDLVTRLKTATGEQIDSYVRTRMNADAVTSLATAQAFCKRQETFDVLILKLIARYIRE